jgi:3-hydroxyisobutyrate dehydrogenase-like beta-hydroxyacid dehydrogenase
MKKFSDDGIPTKRSPLEVSESSDVVITMLPSSAHVSWFHGQSLFRGVSWLHDEATLRDS